jgi:RHS repeat-associated protein
LLQHYRFDSLGRVTGITSPSGDTQTPTTSTVGINYVGTMTTMTDPANRQRRQVTDALGRIVRIDEPDPSGNLGTASAPTQPTFYDYDVLNNLVHIGQGTQNRYFKYDALSRLTHERQSEQDTPYNVADAQTGNNLWSRKYLYNSNGLMTDEDDARQINTHFIYDGLNRISQITYSDTTPGVTYTYDQAHSGYYNQGRLTQVVTGPVATPVTTQQFDYDRMGRVLGQTEKIGTTSYPISYLYNMAGQLTLETYPSGRMMNYAFDQAGRLSMITDGLGTTYDSGFQYAPHGGRTSETFGNTAVQTVAYNNSLQTKQVKLTMSGAEKQRYDYLYGQVNPSDGSVDTTKSTGQIARIDGYTDAVRQWDQRLSYDSLGRLSHVGEYQGGQTSQQTYQLHYDYDRWGNRYQYQQNVNVPGGYTAVQTTDISSSTNRFINTGATPVTYDAAGNITTDTKFRGMSYQYDANGRQTQASNINLTNPQTATYDALGQRVQTVSSGVTRQIVYDAFGQNIAEHTGGVLSRENIYRGGELLASNETSGGLKYVLADVQGSTRAVMSGSSIIARHDYLPFGEEIPALTGWRSSGQGYGATDGIRQRYAGTERDATNGLDHTTWRKYESWSGRWTSPDPYRGSMRVGDPQTHNRYAYVSNDPANARDPSGLDTREITPDFSQLWYFDLPHLGSNEVARAIYMYTQRLDVTLYAISVNSREKQIAEAVERAQSVLDGDSECSKFFAGADFSRRAMVKEALQQLGTLLRPRALGSNSLGIREEWKSGPAPGKDYRVPFRVSVNETGPFFVFNLEKKYPGSIRYTLGSSGAQVLAVLHELAHMIRKPNGGEGYLIEGDGDDGKGSERNTAFIERKCASAINSALKKK